MLKENKKKIFITGGTGLLGWHLLQTVPEDYELACTVFPAEKDNALPLEFRKFHTDIRDREAVFVAMEEIKPDYVIHTASIASVDYAEKNKELARMTNLEGTKNIIEASKKTGSKIVYMSSNAVFDGEKPPYSEDDSVNPLNYYGFLKTEEEKELKRSGINSLIVRAILMYGWNLSVERKDPVTWLIDMLGEGNKINMVDDIFCNPLYVVDCAEAIWQLIKHNKTGTYHVGGGEEISRYDFALLTAEIFGLNKELINPVKNSFFKGISPRPKNTTYYVEKIKKELNFFPKKVREGLEHMKKNHYEKTSNFSSHRRI